MPRAVRSDLLEPAGPASTSSSATRSVAARQPVPCESPEEPGQPRSREWVFGRGGLIRLRLTSVEPAPTGSAHETRGPSSDHIEAMIFHLPGRGDVAVLQMPLGLLGLPVEVARRGLARLPASPLYPLVASHIAEMINSEHALRTDTAVHEFGTACVALTRALIMSAAGLDAADCPAPPTTAVLTDIRDYVQAHLTDPELSPETIARELHISVRYLYKICAIAGFGLEQWIIAQRLERVSHELTRPETRHRSIARIARDHGFRDPSHFSRRFRTAYGMTPRQWRTAAHEPNSKTTGFGEARTVDRQCDPD